MRPGRGAPGSWTLGSPPLLLGNVSCGHRTTHHTAASSEPTVSRPLVTADPRRSAPPPHLDSGRADARSRLATRRGRAALTAFSRLLVYLLVPGALPWKRRALRPSRVARWPAESTRRRGTPGLSTAKGTTMLDETVTKIVDLLWSTPMIYLVLAVGLYFTVRLLFPQVRRIPDMLRYLFGGGDSARGRPSRRSRWHSAGGSGSATSPGSRRRSTSAGPARCSGCG